MRLYVAILIVAFQQQCSLLSPETARTQAEQGLKPYFPHARTIVSGSMLVGITCADLGPAAIRELPASLDNNKSVKQLKTFGGLMGITSFALGFPDTILQLDLTTKQYRMVSASTISGYAAAYTTNCNAASEEQSNTVTASIVNPALVYVGTFRATIARPDGKTQVQTVTDGLGVYTPADFERAKAAELAAREQIIRDEFARRGVTLTNLELVGVKTTRIP